LDERANRQAVAYPTAIKLAKPKISCRKLSLDTPAARNTVLTIAATISATSAAGMAKRGAARNLEVPARFLIKPTSMGIATQKYKRTRPDDP